MEFDWSTFALEVVNFLILVWLLKRFLYRPVLSMVEKRREVVQKAIADADDARAEARELQTQYETRSEQWEQELAQRRRTLEEELESERRKRLDALDTEIAGERERLKARLERESVSREQALQTRAAAQAVGFAARLLKRLNGPELDRRIVAAVVEDLDAMAADTRKALEAALAAGGEVTVTSASALSGEDRRALESALSGTAGGTPKLRFEVDASLLGGLRIRIDDWELDASLDGELGAFAESSRHD